MKVAIKKFVVEFEVDGRRVSMTGTEEGITTKTDWDIPIDAPHVQLFAKFGDALKAVMNRFHKP